MGRKKIDIEKINCPKKRQITFAKRKTGLVKKAAQLSVLCDVDVAVIVFSPTGKLTLFSKDNNIRRVIDRFLDTPEDEVTASISENVGIAAAMLGSDKENLELQIGQLESALEQARNDILVYQQKYESWRDTNNYTSKANLVVIKEQLTLDLREVEHRIRQFQDDCEVKSNFEQPTWASTYLGTLSDLDVPSTRTIPNPQIQPSSWLQPGSQENFQALLASSLTRQQPPTVYPGANIGPPYFQSGVLGQGVYTGAAGARIYTGKAGASTSNPFITNIDGAGVCTRDTSASNDTLSTPVVSVDGSGIYAGDAKASTSTPLNKISDGAGVYTRHASASNDTPSSVDASGIYAGDANASTSTPSNTTVDGSRVTGKPSEEELFLSQDDLDRIFNEYK